MGGGLLIVLVLVSQGRAATTTGSPSSTSPDYQTTEPEPTGSMKFGDNCNTTQDCGFRGAVCNDLKKCQCRPELIVTNHIDKCGLVVDINGTCFFNEQCEARVLQTECRDSRCACRFEMVPMLNKNNRMECMGNYVPPVQERYIDPTMIGVLVGMALMFIIICVVLRLFSKARWRENRTIFNTPNPRLMNVSLLRETKASERRGSKGSNTRAPSRQPSLASLRPQSPAAQSHGFSPRDSRSSNGSARSPTAAVQQQPEPTTETHDVEMQPNSVA